MKRFFVLLCVVSALMICTAKLPSRADFGDFAGDNDYGGFDYDNDYDYDYDDDDDYGYGYGGYYGGHTTSGGSSDFDFMTVIVIIIVAGALIASAAKRYRKASSAGQRVYTGTQPTSASSLRPMSEYKQLDHDFDETALCDRMGNIYMQLQSCWTNKDIEPLRPYLTDNLYNMSARQLDNLRRSGRTNYIERIAVLERKLTGFEQSEGYDKLHLILKTRIVDYTVDADGNVVSGSKTAEKFMTYEWVLIRKTGVTTQKDSGTRTITCPHCGAPVDINASARCEYCDSVLTVDNEDWVISTIKGISQVTK